MSDRKDKPISANETSSKLKICFLAARQQLGDIIQQLLNGNDYELKVFDNLKNLGDYIVEHYEQIDCLVLSHTRLDSLCHRMRKAEILLPTVMLIDETDSFANPTEAELVASLTVENANDIYHQAEIQLYPTQLKEIRSYISLAINKFISLAADASEPSSNAFKPELSVKQKSLIFQQRRLTEKLKERLSYLGFIYKRNQAHFWDNLTDHERDELIEGIRSGYRQILLVYFEQDSETNRLIDEFVDRAFFANISTSQILEIHMDLMDTFAHQLRIEGRNDDILLDYRLPLIDILSHLCEMYRRSIPDADGWINLPLALE